MVAATYTRVNIVFTDDSRTPAIIGAADRVIATRALGFAFDPMAPTQRDEDWLTHLAWTAYCRVKPGVYDFEAFREVYLGNEEIEDDLPEAPTPA